MLLVARFLMGIGSFMLLASILLLMAAYGIGRNEGIVMMASMLTVGLIALGAPSAALGVLLLLLERRRKRVPIGGPDRLLAGAAIALTLFWVGQLLGFIPPPWQTLGPSRGWGA